MNPARQFHWVGFQSWALLLLPCVAGLGCGSSSGLPPVAQLGSSSTTNEVAKAESETPAVARKKPRYTVRKTVTPTVEQGIPRVLLSAGHAKLCQANVGDSFPAFRLPQLGSPTVDFASLQGTQATVVFFWQPDRWMSKTGLVDMQRDLANKFNAKEVSLVGIAVGQPAGAVQTAVQQAQAQFPQLLDADGKAFAQVGSHALPRVYVLDPTGKIVWFDIEYSESTRRELRQTLQVLTKK